MCVVPGVFILFQSEKAQAARGPGLGEAMRGEVGKLLITGVLFAAVFIGVKPIDVVAFFGTFVVLQLAYVIVPLIDARRMMRR